MTSSKVLRTEAGGGSAVAMSDGLAQQVLTGAAKLRGQRDPALALACSGLLLALASDDALPAYLSSSAAAVLASQLLQVQGCLNMHTAPSQPALEPLHTPARQNTARVKSN
eukprot:scaffold72161_cov23-Tisochrysis_lutea.AAC.1